MHKKADLLLMIQKLSGYLIKNTDQIKEICCQIEFKIKIWVQIVFNRMRKVLQHNITNTNATMLFLCLFYRDLRRWGSMPQLNSRP